EHPAERARQRRERKSQCGRGHGTNSARARTRAARHFRPSVRTGRYYARARRRSFRMTAPSEPVGTLDTALAHTQRLMTSEPRLAAEQATEILKVVPGHPLATLFVGVPKQRVGVS